MSLVLDTVTLPDPAGEVKVTVVSFDLLVKTPANEINRLSGQGYYKKHLFTINKLTDTHINNIVDLFRSKCGQVLEITCPARGYNFNGVVINDPIEIVSTNAGECGDEYEATFEVLEIV